ncbi:MAG: alpha/beta hydrolase [Acidobacteriaceae bacterium]
MCAHLSRIGETVGHWLGVQGLLAQNRVASLVFNYSGYGRSTGRIDADQCERDAVAAFNFLQGRMPSQPVSLLGFSLGSGVAAAIATRVAVHYLVLCAAFTSLRKAACCVGLPYSVARLLPAIWNTEETLRTCAAPVLIVHGEKDCLFPATMARDLASACTGPSELILVPQLSHNAPIFNPESSYWSLIAQRLMAGAP